MNPPPGRSRDPATMPGLTLNTGVAGGSGVSQTPVASASTKTATNPNTSILPPPPPASSSSVPTSVTPVPLPQMPYIPTANPNPIPIQPQAQTHAQIQTQTQTQAQNQPHPQPSPRSSSPVRPTYSPITPPLNPTLVPAPAPAPSQRPTYTYNSHADADAGSAIPLPRPEPIDFDSNPDVLALKSAISILQMQRRKAQADMAALDRVKGAALAEPEAFVRDLTEGRVGVEGDRLFVGGVRAQDDDSDDSDGESSSSNNDEVIKAEEVRGNTSGNAPGAAQTAGSDEIPRTTTASATTSTSTSKPPSIIKPDPDAMDTTGGGEPKPWSTLPKPQSIVRCPPINWSQYAVVGESLDKLHSEQLARPAQGNPAAVAPDGRVEFPDGPNLGRQERLPGIAAPYAPGKDRLVADKKHKGPKR